MRTIYSKTNSMQEKEKESFLKRSFGVLPEEASFQREDIFVAKASRLFNITAGKFGSPLKPISPPHRRSQIKPDKGVTLIDFGFAKNTMQVVPSTLSPKQKRKRIDRTVIFERTEPKQKMPLRLSINLKHPTMAS